VLDSWDNVTSEADDVIIAVGGNMAVVPCDVSWYSRPPAELQFHRDAHPLTTRSSSKPLSFSQHAEMILLSVQCIGQIIKLLASVCQSIS